MKALKDYGGLLASKDKFTNYVHVIVIIADLIFILLTVNCLLASKARNWSLRSHSNKCLYYYVPFVLLPTANLRQKYTITFKST